MLSSVILSLMAVLLSSLLFALMSMLMFSMMLFLVFSLMLVLVSLLMACLMFAAGSSGCLRLLHGGGGALADIAAVGALQEAVFAVHVAHRYRPADTWYGAFAGVTARLVLCEPVFAVHVALRPSALAACTGRWCRCCSWFALANITSALVLLVTAGTVHPTSG
jgi:hypothetical protein